MQVDSYDGVWTKRGLGHGLPYGLPVVDFKSKRQHFKLMFVFMGRRIGHYCDVSNINAKLFISYAKRQKYMPNFLFHMVSLLEPQQTPKIHSEVTSPFPFCHQDILNCIPCAKLYLAC